ncbi:MAG: hypothetical protein JWL81_129 [Verrucomicrobiales bacterium]|nr:hypothetical protein [Verrucomicrobiales bacterium]
MNPNKVETVGMVPVARFHGMDEVEAFRSIAQECGVETRVANVRRTDAGFDFTLGGGSQFLGWVVLAVESDVPALTAHLEKHLEVDPLDPMRSAKATELLAIVDGPLEGNLCEKVTAARILAEQSVVVQSVLPGTGVDTHLAGDARQARWLGITGWIFTLRYIVMYVLDLLSPESESPGLLGMSFGFGMQTSAIYGGDAVAENVKPFLLLMIPMATGFALLAKRKLKDGTVRPMFPDHWRKTGYFHFWLPVFFMICVMVTHFTATR